MYSWTSQCSVFCSQELLFQTRVLVKTHSLSNAGCSNFVLFTYAYCRFPRQQLGVYPRAPFLNDYLSILNLNVNLRLNAGVRSRVHRGKGVSHRGLGRAREGVGAWVRRRHWAFFLRRRLAWLLSARGRLGVVVEGEARRGARPATEGRARKGGVRGGRTADVWARKER